MQKNKLKRVLSLDKTQVRAKRDLKLNAIIDLTKIKRVDFYEEVEMLNQNQFEQLMGAIKENSLVIKNTRKELLIEIKKIDKKVDKNTEMIKDLRKEVKKNGKDIKLIKSLPTIQKELTKI